MKNNILYYAPRIIAILFIPIISLFVLDVFNDRVQIPIIIVALFIHLIPGLTVLFALLFAWKHEEIGGMVFLFLFIAALILFKNPYPTNLLLFAPLLLAGVLFEIHYAATHKRAIRKLIKEGRRLIVNGKY